MEKVFIVQRLKKYLFFISIVFMILTTSHLFYSYIYSDAKEIAIKGGTISEALIGEIPFLNPLKQNSAQDKYLNSILYRSLLRYDVHGEKIIGDLAKCDLNNLLKIECFLNTNITWSNGENITTKDIIKTFETLKTSKVNSNMSLLLENITFSSTGNSIVFTNTKKDINFLKIFFQPIVSHKVLNLISKKEMEGRFSLAHGIYSGKYKLVNISDNKTTQVQTLTLKKNEEYYKNPAYIETLLFKIFPTNKDFLSNKNSINIFNDKNNIVAENTPRLRPHTYILPQYVSLYLNARTITSNPLRQYISQQISKEKIIEALGKKAYQSVINPFFSDNSYTPNREKKSLGSLLKSQEYFSRNNILVALKKERQIEFTKMNTPVIKKIISGEAQVEKSKIGTDLTSTGGTKKASTNINIIQEPKKSFKIIKKDNPNSKIITEPKWVETYNFISNSKISFKGKVPKNVTSVYINNIKVPRYRAGNNFFYYRIHKSSDSLKKGENKVKIFFTINGKKILQEELLFHYNTNKNTLRQKEKAFLEKKVAIIIPEVTPPIIIEKNIQKNNTLSGSIINNKNTRPESDKYKQLQKDIAYFESIDPQYFYNRQRKTYSLTLYYISEKKSYKKTADIIKEDLEKKGIKIILQPINTKDLNTLILSGKKNYDLLLAGVKLGYFKFNLYTYFHSSQINKGYNFSNFKNLDLDIILKKLKTTILSKEDRLLSEDKVLKIIHEQALVKTLYTPILYNFVDKNIKNYSLEKNIPQDMYRFDAIERSYIKKDKVIDSNNITLSGYISFLWKTLF